MTTCRDCHGTGIYKDIRDGDLSCPACGGRGKIESKLLPSEADRSTPRPRVGGGASEGR